MNQPNPNITILLTSLPNLNEIYFNGDDDEDMQQYKIESLSVNDKKVIKLIIKIIASHFQNIKIIDEHKEIEFQSILYRSVFFDNWRYYTISNKYGSIHELAYWKNELCSAITLYDNNEQKIKAWQISDSQYIRKSGAVEDFVLQIFSRYRNDSLVNIKNRMGVLDNLLRLYIHSDVTNIIIGYHVF